jgi:monolysocardiolipin acyltransferase
MWGVGKLIAHAPVPPIVICFYHSGMEHLMPQVEYPRKLLVKFPQSGHDVKVKFGTQMQFDDLIREHESLYGPLWKYRVKNDDDNDDDFHSEWDSKPTDYILYHKITARIEQELLELGHNMPYFKGASNIRYLLEAHGYKR